MNNVGKNFYELLICENTMKLPVIHNDIQEDVRNTLQDCLRNWNIGAKSKEKGVQDHHEGVCTSFGNHAITPSRPIFLSITPLRPIFSWARHRALFTSITPSRSFFRSYALTPQKIADHACTPSTYCLDWGPGFLFIDVFKNLPYWNKKSRELIVVQKYCATSRLFVPATFFSDFARH